MASATGPGDVRIICDTAEGPPGFTGWFHEAGRTGRFAGTLLPKWLPGWLSRSGIQRRHIRVGPGGAAPTAAWVVGS